MTTQQNHSRPTPEKVAALIARLTTKVPQVKQHQSVAIASFLLLATAILPTALPRGINPLQKAIAQSPPAQPTQPAPFTAPNQKTRVTIGILAKRGDDKVTQQWQATADYLTQEVPGYEFELVPLDFEETYQAVKDGTIDFVIANSGMYVDFEGRYNANRIATLKNLRLGNPYTLFGGVIFRRADRPDIQTLKDLKGKKMMAVNETSLGGWQMQWREMKRAGIDRQKDLKSLEFGETHDNVVYAVRDGLVDVGAVRTDTLERMANEGKIDLSQFMVINQKPELQTDFPFLLSTDLYPEWPFAATQNTPNELSEDVSAALLRMPADSQAAKDAKAEGWTVPLNYRPVDDLFLELQIGPYEDIGELTFGEYIQKYWHWLALGLLPLIVIVALIIIYQQQKVNKAMQESTAQQQEVIRQQTETEAILKRVAEEQRQQKDKLEQEIYQLLDDVGNAVDGDLTVRASLESMEMSTVADLFNAMIENLKDIAIRVKQSSSQVSSSFLENTESIQSLAAQAVAEAQETRKTLQSVEEMSRSIQEVSQNANQASSLANDAYTVTQKGTRVIDKTVGSIRNLRTTMGETAKKMKRLGESSQKISQVVSLIEEIALKTNLLAINASVEASRAGEQGEGFSIVAEQVATLAEQSTIATKEIAQIVTAIQQETKEVAEAMELGTSQVVDSTRLVEATKLRLEKVLGRSKSINRLMQSISQKTVSQTDTSLAITKLMEQIAQQSEQRVLYSQRVAGSMQASALVSRELESAVEQFKVEADGSVKPIESFESVASVQSNPVANHNGNGSSDASDMSDPDQASAIETAEPVNAV
jgi:methyl-accepting chemotaxis protein PixJ